MIQITDKFQCCGCEACVQSCPKQCISFNEDNEGFRYPKVDESSCVECGACQRTCPVLNQSNPRQPISFFASKCLDDSVRQASSSGGVFTLLAQDVVHRGGVVFGARFNEHWEVIHSYTETIGGIADFQTSKYVQSRIGDSFRHAKEFLKQGRVVLFSGTPCQIAALRLFLQHDYDNLLTIDIVCHGVPSPKVWQMYIETLKDNARTGHNIVSHPLNSFIKGSNAFNISEDDLKIERISFRDKSLGWKKYSLILSFSKAFANDKISSVSLANIHSEDPYMRTFLSNVNLRLSCFQCPAKEGKGESDITLGDFWGIDRLMPEYDDGKGVSLVILNTQRGVNEFGRLPVEKIKVSKKDALAYNPAYLSSSKPNPYRSRFFKKLGSGNNNIINLMNNANQPSIHVRFWRKLRHYMNLIRLLIYAKAV